MAGKALTTILDPELYEALRQSAERNHRSMSREVLHAVSLYLTDPFENPTYKEGWTNKEEF